MTRTLALLLLFAAAPLAHAEEVDPAAPAEICGAPPIVAGALPDEGLSFANEAHVPVGWVACPSCAGAPLSGVEGGAPGQSETPPIVIFAGERPTAAPVGPPSGDACRSYDFGRVPKIAPDPSADPAWSLTEDPRLLEASYCAYDDGPDTLCLSFRCDLTQEGWHLTAGGQVGGLDLETAREIEMDIHVDDALAGYLTFSPVKGAAGNYQTAYVRQLDTPVLDALRRGAMAVVTLRVGKAEGEVVVGLDGSARAIGTVQGQCADLQRRATPDNAPDRFVALRGVSSPDAVTLARRVLSDRLVALREDPAGTGADVRRANLVTLPDGWRFLEAMVGPSQELGETRFGRFILVKPPQQDWVVFDPLGPEPRVYVDLKHPIGTWPTIILTTDRRDVTLYERWYWDGSNYLFRERIPQ